ncbi:FAS1-like dehydratase domain-containing protein [Nocardia arizonensis]|uniref:FAS1-like dehydratase domain-containing protein n=1 Tax=Nocardia arizonensis TaxID=1141647 RepID=UPI000A4A3FCF|nr:MaoC family dehydratase N-terminal domain-containing protein [Nocardia arizonensis]
MFARSIGDTSVDYSDGQMVENGLAGVVAPPTFVQCGAQFDPDFPLRPHEGRPWMGSGATASGLAEPANAEADAAGQTKQAGGGGPLHAEQRFDFARPVRVGDVLTAQQRAGRTWEKQGRRGGTLMFTESITEYRDAAGELVVTATAVAVATQSAPVRSGAGEESHD